MRLYRGAVSRSSCPLVRVTSRGVWGEPPGPVLGALEAGMGICRVTRMPVDNFTYSQTGLAQIQEARHIVHVQEDRGLVAMIAPRFQ